MILLNGEGYELQRKEFPNQNSFVLKESMRYFDYAGISGMLFGIYRYQGAYDASESKGWSYLFPYGVGNLDYIMNSFAANDKAFIGYLNLIAGDPFMCVADRLDSFNREMCMTNKYGEIAQNWFGGPAGNPAHPEYRKIFISHFRNLIRQYGVNPVNERRLCPDP